MECGLVNSGMAGGPQPPAYGAQHYMQQVILVFNNSAIIFLVNW